MDDQLDAALSVPGYETQRSAHRVVFTRRGGAQPSVVVWSVSDEELRRLAASRRAGAGPAWGSRGRSGFGLLSVHVQEALLTFEGPRGERLSTATGLEVQRLD